MLEVVPTMMRHLFCNWQPAFSDVGILPPPRTRRMPLPEFLPPNQFSDLQLPEVQIDPEDAEAEGVPLLKALGIVVPGRVTRRFAPYQAGLSHWIPIDVTQEIRL